MRLSPLESTLNRNIAGAAAARELCKRLSGKVMALHFDGLPLSLYFHSLGDSMTLATDTPGEVHATLSATPLALLRLAGPQPESVIRSGAVHIHGDAEVAQAFSELLKEARPDLEEELSRFIGDVAAHQVGKLARGSLQFARRAADTLARNVSEYLQEESRDVPSRTEAEELSASIDVLRDDVERFEARLNLLERARQSR